MGFELLVVPDCPHAAAAEAMFRSVLARADVQPTVEVVVIADQASAVRRRFVGSPSFFVDGRDLFPTQAPPAVACRVYAGVAGGLRGLPDETELLTAVRGAVGR